MTTLARTENTPIDWDQWVVAIALPCACFIADYAIGGYVVRVAPAALLSLATLGIAAFVLSRWPGGGTAGLIAIGPMWLCGAVAAIIGFALTILAFIGVLFSIPMMSLLDQRMWPLLALAALATTPVCTGAVYLMRANALTRTLAVAHGKPKAVAAALAGGLAASAVILAAEFVDRRWVDTQIEALDKSSPQAWPATLASLNAYPLCSRARCEQRVCGQLFRQFGETPAGGLVTVPNAPAPHDAAFRQAYGVPIRDGCKRYD